MKIMRFVSIFILAILCILSFFSNRYQVDKLINSLSINSNKVSERGYMIDIDDYDTILKELDVNILDEFYLEDRLIVEGYSNRINDYIVINDRKINIQISLSEDCCLVGIPLIENSF